MMDWLSANSAGIQAFAAAVQAFFALILVWVGIGQWWVYRRQAQIMATQARSSAMSVQLEQPYVLVNDVGKPTIVRTHDDWLSHGPMFKPVCEIELINYGRTPAALISIHATILFVKLVPLAKNADYRLLHMQSSREVISAARIPITVKIGGLAFDEKTFERIKTHDLRAMVYGFVIYSDMFGNDISTYFGFSAGNVDAPMQRIDYSGYNHRGVENAYETFVADLLRRHRTVRRKKRRRYRQEKE